MKACRIVRPGLAEPAEIPDAVPQPGETTIAIRRIGLCGTDLKTYLGTNPIVTYPRVIGHEIGAVLEQDAEIRGTVYPPGTVVTVNPYTVCGKCPSCRANRPNACRENQTLGNQRDGAGCERFAISGDRIVPVPDLSTDQAACIEPLSVGFHAVRRAEVRQEDTVLIIGAGMIGLGVVAGCVARGAKTIVADLSDAKLATALNLGATVPLNVNNRSLTDEVHRLTNGDGPDVVIEAVGTVRTYQDAVSVVAFGGRVVYIGYAAEDVPFTTKLFVMKELDIRGSRNATMEDFHDVAQAIRSGTIRVDEVITHRFPIDDIDKALRTWAETPNEVTKIVVEVN